MRNSERGRNTSSKNGTRIGGSIRAPSSALRILLGAHMSIGGGVHRAIERARSIKCTAMQIFVKNNMQWFARPLVRTEISAFLDHAQRGELGAVFAHANYLINLAATNPQFHANSMRALAEELTRADQLVAVSRPASGRASRGRRRGGSREDCDSIDRFSPACRKTKTQDRARNDGRPGSCLGHDFGHLAHILANVREPERLCVCLDTAHVFAAGYDLGSEKATQQMFSDFDRIIGLERLAALI